MDHHVNLKGTLEFLKSNDKHPAMFLVYGHRFVQTLIDAYDSEQLITVEEYTEATQFLKTQLEEKDKTISELREQLATVSDVAREVGWNAHLENLMQNGSKTDIDFFDAGGNRLGRFHGFFPAGATRKDRATHYTLMAEIETAADFATKINWREL